MKNVTPNLVEIERIRKDPPQGTVVIVNLMKFQKDDEGRQLFRKYLEQLYTIMDELGIEPNVIYTGAAGTDFSSDEDWDLVALAQYKSFEDFARLMTHPDYINKATPFRDQAMEKTVMMLSTPVVIGSKAIKGL